MTEIPEEAVEAACVAMNGGVAHAHHRERWEPEVRTILTAALPHLRVQETPALIEVLTKHRMYTTEGGDGYHEPFESSLYCSCDPRECLATWIQTEHGDELDFDLIHASHVAGYLRAPRPVVDREAVIAALHNYDHGHRWGEPICERYACEHIYPARADVVLALLPTEEDTKGEGS